MFDVFAYLVQEYPDFKAPVRTLSNWRALFAAGFEDEDIEDALSWLDLLDSAAAPEPLAQPAGGMQVFNDEEMDRLSLETRGFCSSRRQSGAGHEPARAGDRTSAGIAPSEVDSMWHAWWC